jgi:hypothetical protein
LGWLRGRQGFADVRIADRKNDGTANLSPMQRHRSKSTI